VPASAPVRAPSGGEKDLEARRVVRSTFAVDAGYRVAFLVAPGVARHGPEIQLVWRAWRRLEICAAMGYYLSQGGGRDGATWSRWGLPMIASARWALPLSRAWDLIVGGRGGVVRVAAEATSAHGVRARAGLWEVHVGGVGAAMWRLSRHFGISLEADLTWLPVGHEIRVADHLVARSGGIEISLGVSLRLGL